MRLREGLGIRRGQSEEGTGNSVTNLRGALTTEYLELTPLIGVASPASQGRNVA